MLQLRVADSLSTREFSLYLNARQTLATVHIRSARARRTGLRTNVIAAPASVMPDAALHVRDRAAGRMAGAKAG